MAALVRTQQTPAVGWDAPSTHHELAVCVTRAGLLKLSEGSGLRLPGLRSGSITFGSCSNLGDLLNFSEFPFPYLWNADFVL